MSSFVLERPVVSPELDEAMASFQENAKIQLQPLNPAVVVLSKRMFQRAIMADKGTGGRTVAENIAGLAERESRAIEVKLGYLSIVGDNAAGEKKCLGFKIIKGKKPDSREVLLNERKGYAHYFGISLHEPEGRFQSFYVPAFSLEGDARNKKDELIAQWRLMRADNQLIAATLSEVRLRMLEED